VKKHSGMGVAVITLRSQAARDAVLAVCSPHEAVRHMRRKPASTDEPAVADIDGVEAQVKPQVDRDTKMEVKTDIFAAWGHKIERNNPLDAQSIADAFDKLHKEADQAARNMGISLGAVWSPSMGPTLATAPPMAQQVFPVSPSRGGGAPPPPPAHAPAVGQILQQNAAFAQPGGQMAQQVPSPQHQQQVVFPDQQYWLAQQQQQYAAQVAAQRQYEAQAQQYQQQQYLLAQQQQQQQQQQYSLQQQAMQAQMQMPAAKEMGSKPLPKPMQIKNPKDGQVVDIGIDFKAREPPKPMQIINPHSKQVISGS